jgi:serine/threonine protein kinase
MAPELIRCEHAGGFTVDWWSLGVITYRILIGSLPFTAMTIRQVFDNIISHQIDWPPIGYGDGMISPEAKDFIERLLTEDDLVRLGARGPA